MSDVTSFLLTSLGCHVVFGLPLMSFFLGGGVKDRDTTMFQFTHNLISAVTHRCRHHSCSRVENHTAIRGKQDEADLKRNNGKKDLCLYLYIYEGVFFNLMLLCWGLGGYT